MEKKTTKKATATKETAVKEKKTTTCKCTKKCATVVYNEETAGCRAGDIYQALAAAEKALTVKEIAKAAKISEEETFLGLGWLLRESKLAVAENKIALA